MPAPPKGASPRLDLGRLPIAGPLLIGRETELARLDAAWEDPNTRVLTLVAFGGMGKSALVSRWLESMSMKGWRGARRVLDWSFYSQGTEERVTSSITLWPGSEIAIPRPACPGNAGYGWPIWSAKRRPSLSSTVSSHFSIHSRRRSRGNSKTRASRRCSRVWPWPIPAYAW